MRNVWKLFEHFAVSAKGVNMTQIGTVKKNWRNESKNRIDDDRHMRA